MKKENILLLGGGGFLGSALARQLDDKDATVHVITPRKPEKTPENAIIHQGSLDDDALINSILPSCGTIIHLASSTNPGNSARHPEKEGHLNITPTLDFLSVLQNYKPFHLIYLSSGGAVYGNPATIPVKENDRLAPKSYYGAGKAAIETFLRVLSSPPGQNITVVRPPNFYGPGQPCKIGFGVIRTILEHLFRGTVMEIWGNGETVRDYLYIDDMVSALNCLINMPQDNGTYNIASGKGLSLNQVIEIIETVCNRELDVKYRDKRKSDVDAIVLDSSRFIKRTGWQPKVSFEEGIRRTWQWVQKQ
jgi:UDP-glucose 4-epimerase